MSFCEAVQLKWIIVIEPSLGGNRLRYLDDVEIVVTVKADSNIAVDVKVVV